MNDKALALVSQGIMLTGGLEDIVKRGELLVQSGLLPAQIKNGAQAAIIMMAGAEVGVSPFKALANIYVLNGNREFEAPLVAELVERAYGQNALVFEPEMSNATRAVVRCMKPGWDKPRFIKYTIEEAKQAGLLGKQNWRQYPADMLASRAITRAGRRFFSAALGGAVYTEEEMGSETWSPDELDSTDVHVEDVTDVLEGSTRETSSDDSRPSTDVRVQSRDIPASPGEEADTPATPTPVVAEAVDTDTGEILDGEYTEVEEPPLTEAQQRKILSLAKELGWNADKLRGWIYLNVDKVQSVGTLSKKQASEAITHLRMVVDGHNQQPVMDSSEEAQQNHDTEDSPEFFSYLRDLSRLKGEDIKPDDIMFASLDADERMQLVKNQVMHAFNAEIRGADPSDDASQQYLKDLRDTWSEHVSWTEQIERNYQKKYGELVPV